LKKNRYLAGDVEVRFVLISNLEFVATVLEEVIVDCSAASRPVWVFDYSLSALSAMHTGESLMYQPDAC